MEDNKKEMLENNIAETEENFEEASLTMELFKELKRNTKRWSTIAIVSIVLWFGTIVTGVCGALWFLTQYEFESYVQDGSGYNSIHTGDGDAINGAEILQGTEEKWKS